MRILTVVLMFLASSAAAQLTAPEVQVLDQGAASVQQMAALTQAGIEAAQPWYKHFAGRLDLTHDFALAAYQSVTDPDEVLGLGKRFVYLKRDEQDLINLGLFGGINRQDNHGMAGPTGQVPGSALDWALGTKMGDAWLPKLKTGMFFGWDITRPHDLKAKPNFIGVGINLPIGGQ